MAHIKDLESVTDMRDYHKLHLIKHDQESECMTVYGKKDVACWHLNEVKGSYNPIQREVEG